MARSARGGVSPLVVARWRREIGGTDAPRTGVRYLRGRAGALNLRHLRVRSADTDNFEAWTYFRQLTSIGARCELLSPGEYIRDRHCMPSDQEPAVYVFTHTLPGTLTLRRGPEEFVYGPGQLGAVRSDIPMTVTLSGPADPAGLEIPLAQLGEERAFHRGLTTADTLLARATAQFIRHLACSAAAGQETIGPEVERAGIELVAATLGHQGADGFRRSENSVHVRAAVADLITRRFRDPDFTTTDVARELHISRRHLYRHFSVAADSLAMMIACRRVAGVREMLMSEPALTLEEIAAAAGFRSVATMRNRFRAETGMTPAEYRRVEADESARYPVRMPGRPVADPFEDFDLSG